MNSFNVLPISILLLKYFAIDNCFELQAFKEHLALKHLRHAIIIHSNFSMGRDQRPAAKKFNKEHLSQLMLAYPVRFFDPYAKRRDFNRLFDHNAPRAGIFLRHPPPAASDPAIDGLLGEASQHSRFNFSFSWFVVMDDIAGNPIKSVASVFDSQYIMINADMTAAIVKGNSFLELYDLYKLCHLAGSPLNIEYKGKWSLTKGFEIKDPYRDSFVQRRNNFRNCPLNVGTALVNKHSGINMTNMEYLKNYKDFLQSDVMQRKTYQLLQMTEFLYNCSLNISFLPTWGSNINGTWTGIVALLITGELEFTVCPMRHRSDRTTVLTFSSELHTERIGFLLRHPKRTSIRNIFFEPLDDSVWWCILVLILMTTILLGLHVHTEYQLYWKLREQSKGVHSTAGDFNFLLLTILEAIFMQGPDPEQYRYNSTRILLISLSVFSLLLMQFYGAFIVSSLLSEAPRTITNVQALYESSLEIGLENVTYCREILANAADPIVRAIYSRRINNGQPNHVLSMEQGVERIGRGGFAMFVPTFRAYGQLKNSLTETQFCELQEVTFSAATQQAGIGLGKSSQYKKFINNAIIKFRESSLHQYNEKRWEVPKIDCSVIHDTEVQVDLVHFAPVVVFLLFATGFALLVMLAEILFKRIEKYLQYFHEFLCERLRRRVAHDTKIKS